MTGEPIAGAIEEEEYDEKALVPMMSSGGQYGSAMIDANGTPRMAIMSAEEVEVTRLESAPEVSTTEELFVDSGVDTGAESDPKLINGEIKAVESDSQTETVAKQEEVLTPVEEPPPPPMVPIEETKASQESGPVVSSMPNLANYTKRFVYCLARNLYTIKKIALFLAFVINLMLLFYKVTSFIPDGEDNGDDNGTEESGSAEVVAEIVEEVTTMASELISGIDY